MLPECHTCCVPVALEVVFRISIISAGKKDWISLSKKRNLKTNGFIKDATGRTEGCCKSAELTGTYIILASNWLDGMLTKPA